MALATSTATLTTKTSSLPKPYQSTTTFNLSPHFPSKSLKFPPIRHSICCVMAPDMPSKAEDRDLSVLQRPDSFGRFGKYGGKYVPETLMYALSELESAFRSLSKDDDFQVINSFLLLFKFLILVKLIGLMIMKCCQSFFYFIE